MKKLDELKPIEISEGLWPRVDDYDIKVEFMNGDMTVYEDGKKLSTDDFIKKFVASFFVDVKK